MKAALLYLAASAAAIAITVFVALNAQPEYRVINCGVSEISPDFTPEMRQACRKARMDKIQ